MSANSLVTGAQDPLWGSLKRSIRPHNLWRRGITSPQNSIQSKITVRLLNTLANVSSQVWHSNVGPNSTREKGKNISPHHDPPTQPNPWVDPTRLTSALIPIATIILRRGIPVSSDVALLGLFISGLSHAMTYPGFHFGVYIFGVPI